MMHSNASNKANVSCNKSISYDAIKLSIWFEKNLELNSPLKYVNCDWKMDFMLQAKGSVSLQPVNPYTPLSVYV